MALDPSRSPGGIAQPYTRIVWPHEDSIAARAGISTRASFGGFYGSNVWDTSSATKLPAVARATAIYSALIKQCELDAYRGAEPLPRPRLLDRPDPDDARGHFVQVQIEDYLWHGNAVHLILARYEDGWPAIVRWVPASWITITTDGDGIHYYTAGGELPIEDVVHVKRSADRHNPARGVGVVEQHLATLDRVALEEEYERTTLLGAGVPSVAIITPNPSLSGEEAAEGKLDWMEKYAGPVREPAILPLGTSVIPLGWSPSDSQMIEARKMSLQDVANAFNLDGYWLGAEASGLTYRSPAPLYLSLLRTSLEGVLTDFEEAWAFAWLPRGQRVHFDRNKLTRDTFAESVKTLDVAIKAGIIDAEEARLYLGLRAGGASPTIISPVATAEDPELEGEEEESEDGE